MIFWTSGSPAESRCVESPQSRLSKRITRKPADTSRWQRSARQRVSGAPTPMISTIGSALGDPRDSNSISMPPTLVRAMRLCSFRLEPDGDFAAPIRRRAIDDVVAQEAGPRERLELLAGDIVAEHSEGPPFFRAGPGGAQAQEPVAVLDQTIVRRHREFVGNVVVA